MHTNRANLRHAKEPYEVSSTQAEKKLQMRPKKETMPLEEKEKEEET